MIMILLNFLFFDKKENSMMKEKRMSGIVVRNVVILSCFLFFTFSAGQALALSFATSDISLENIELLDGIVPIQGITWYDANAYAEDDEGSLFDGIIGSTGAVAETTAEIAIDPYAEGEAVFDYTILNNSCYVQSDGIDNEYALASSHIGVWTEIYPASTGIISFSAQAIVTSVAHNATAEDDSYASGEIFIELYNHVSFNSDSFYYKHEVGNPLAHAGVTETWPHTELVELQMTYAAGDLVTLSIATEALAEVFAPSSGATVDPVPEPSTMLLFGCGLIGLASIARKKLINA